MTETVKKRKRSHCSIQVEENITESVPQGDNLNKEVAVAKRNRYTFEEKKKILEECKTLNSRELCVKYGLNKSVLSKWISNEEIIKNAAKTSHTKTLKKVSETNELDAKLFTWLSDCRCKGIPVSGPMLCRQALVINSRIGGPENFKASHGWLEKWKRRTDVKNLNITAHSECEEVATMPLETPPTHESSGDLRNIDKHESVDETPSDESLVHSNESWEHNNVAKHLSDMNLHYPIRMKNGSTGNITAEVKPEGQVLVLYTGGTIGMVRNERGALAPIANTFVSTVKKYPHMHDRVYAENRFGCLGPLVLPLAGNDSRRIIYNVLEYSPLCDSSNMTMDDWIRIAIDIRESYEYFDGFVVLHGTDTLSYTASALSFMLESLGKTVVITGSQLPIFDARSDGLINFLSSLVIAGNYNIPEVCVFFGNNLMRGNRTSKMASAAFGAFESPNCPPLAVAGIKVDVDYRSIFRPCALEKFNVHKTLNRNVGLLRIFPSITSDLVRAFLQPPIEGVVLQTYGAGNVPNNRADIFAEIRAATDRGVIIVNITQCSRDGVIDLYESGKLLLDAGVTLGYDMTPEAALTKLAYVLSKTSWDCKTKRKMMETSLRGEMSTCRRVNVQDSSDVMKALGFHSEAQLLELAPIIFPALMSEAVVAGDFSKVKSLQSYGADISQPNADHRTVLHVACCEAEPDVVRQLLEMGANVHMKDRFDRTPLTEAIENDRHEIIKLLLQCGAHLHGNAFQLGGKLCCAAASGNTTRLRSYAIAGADLTQPDVSGRTAMHFAALHNRHSVIRYLLDEGIDYRCIDMIGQTPRDLADRAGSIESLKLFDSAYLKTSPQATDVA